MRQAEKTIQDYPKALSEENSESAISIDFFIGILSLKTCGN